MVPDITKLLKGAASRGEPVALHELLWTIDARHRAIPTLEEIARARENAPPFRVARSKRGVSLVPGSVGPADELTEKDLDVAMRIYGREVERWLRNRPTA